MRSAPLRKKRSVYSGTRGGGILIGRAADGQRRACSPRSAPLRSARVIACLDLEGVLVPEIWIAVAEHTATGARRPPPRDGPDSARLWRPPRATLEAHPLGPG